MTTAATLRFAATVSLFAIGVAAAPSIALAQTNTVAVDPVESDDIVVTATRREEQSKDVPVAVSVLAGEKLDVINSSGLDIRFLSGRTPSLLVESSFGRTFPRFYIRGLGNTDFDPTSAQPVSVVYDDVALENAMLKSFPVFDLASVEVLRGPQGTLFGRNTPAGVIKLNSARPDPDKSSMKASISVASYNTINTEVAANVPLGGGFALRVSGLVQYRDNYVTNTNANVAGNLADAKLEGYSDKAGRIQLGYSNGNFDALINVHGRDLDGTPRVFRAGAFRPGSNDFNTGFDIKRVSLDGLTNQKLEAYGGNLKLDYLFDGIGTLHSITAYEQVKVTSTGDVDGGAAYSFPTGALGVALFAVNTGGTTKPKEFSQELRFETVDMNGFRAQLGGYYFHQKLTYNEVAYNSAGTLTQNVLHDNKNENFGIFASGEYSATDALTLRAGVRYSNDKRKDIITGTPSFPAPATVALLGVPIRAKADNVSWDASATYKLTSQVNAYARFATGYLGPAISDRSNFGTVPSVGRKQTTVSGEGGFKGKVGGIGFDLTGYYYRTKDFQATAVGGAANTAQLITIDHVVGYGAEAEFNLRIENLYLTAGGSYNFTEIRDPNQTVAVCTGGCTVTQPTTINAGGTPVARVDGNDLPQAPRYIANWTARYGVPVGDGELFAFTDWAYRSKVNYFLYTAAEFRGKSSLEGGVRVGYAFNDGLEVAAFARNITNQIRAISAIDFNNLTAMVNEPRIIGGEVKFKF